MQRLFNPLNNVHDFDPDKHIPDLSGKVVIVTGANAGCGKETVLQLAKHSPGRIYLAARSKAKYDDAMKAVAAATPNASEFVRFLELDLASLASLKAAADKVISENDRLDLLVNNAGVMAVPHCLTADGFEVQFGTNHIGHALLTRQLLPLMEQTTSEADSDVRIVNVSSGAHTLTNTAGITFSELKTPMENFHPGRLYAQSKLANLLHARELANRYPKILSVSIHPGRVESKLDHTFKEQGGLVSRFAQVMDYFVTPMSVDKGALTQLWAATWKKDDIVNGAYYAPVGKEDPGSKLSRDSKLQERLWTWTEDELKASGH